MPDTEVGLIIKGDAARDAIHIAVIPLTAGEDLYVGNKVRLSLGSLEVALDGEYSGNRAVGIVDPFLEDYMVRKGQKFWCFIFPNTVTGMRHVWQHPQFIEVQEASSEHEVWLRKFADRWNFDYEELIEAGIGAAREDWRYATAHGKDLHSAYELGEDHGLFWDHLEGMTGQAFSQEHRNGMGWSCTC